MESRKLRFDFDTPVDRRESASVKWDRYAGRDVLPLWVADMDFAAPAPILEALYERVDHGVFGYGNPPASLAEAVVAAMKRDYGWRVRGDWLVWLPGLVTGLNVACRAVGEPGDSVFTASPVYQPFFSAPRFADREVVSARMVRVGPRWQWDFGATEAAITPRTRLFLLCNPHNPTGRVFTRDELLDVAHMAERRDLVIVSDEIHCGLVLDPACRHQPLAALDKAIAARTITLMAPSKTWNIAGLSCAFAIISDDDLRRRFQMAMRGIVPHVNVMGYAAAEAAYRLGEPWRRALVRYLRGNAARVLEAVGQMPGLSMAPVEATCLAWIDAREMGLENPVAFFETAGVGLSDGTDFGAPGFLRLNFGCPRSTLNEALHRMSAALSSGVQSIV
ncbi:MAG: PatB family C-S lyase [Rhodocyclaceae bacterium]|nr:PatB family C-S lyase [Rhodocyclaceae bacterium]